MASGFVKWIVTAALDGIVGLALGLLLIPVVTRAIMPFLSIFFPEKKSGH